MWVIGFFVVVGLPKGVMVQLNLIPGERFVDASAKDVNFDKKEIFKWHLSRLIPFNEFRNQKEVTAQGILVYVNEDRDRRFKLKKKFGVATIEGNEGDEANDVFVKYLSELRKYVKGQRSRKPRLGETLTVTGLKDMLIEGDEELKVGTDRPVRQTYYTTKDEKERITNITFFIQ